jgi:hypothetical protein
MGRSHNKSTDFMGGGYGLGFIGALAHAIGLSRRDTGA